MKKSIKLIAYPIVALLVILIAVLFLKLFAFNEDKEINNINVSEELVNKIYSYLPVGNDYDRSLYNMHYTPYNNLSYSARSNMIYNYILKYDEFSIETANSNEQSTIKAKYKISKENFLKAKKDLFGDVEDYSINEFKISDELSGKEIDKYIYIYEDNNQDNSIVLKERIGYTVAEDGNVIEINEYFVKCNLETKYCYNDDGMTDINRNFLYQENLNLSDYKNVLKQYVHTYRLENNSYHWESTDTI